MCAKMIDKYKIRKIRKSERVNTGVVGETGFKFVSITRRRKWSFETGIRKTGAVINKKIQPSSAM